MDEGELAALIGERVRALRQERALSLGALAARAGVGKGSLSEIERGTRNPNLSTLYALANALAAPLAALIADRVGTRVAADGISVRLLDAHDRDAESIEIYAIELEAGVAHRSDAHGAAVTERLMVTRGRMRAGREGATVDLGSGDSASWTSDGPHLYVALDGAASAVLVVTTPRG